MTPCKRDVSMTYPTFCPCSEIPLTFFLQRGVMASHPCFMDAMGYREDISRGCQVPAIVDKDGESKLFHPLDRAGGRLWCHEDSTCNIYGTLRHCGAITHSTYVPPRTSAPPRFLQTEFNMDQMMPKGREHEAPQVLAEDIDIRAAEALHGVVAHLASASEEVSRCAYVAGVY